MALPHVTLATVVKLKVLGAHNLESSTTRCVSLLVDDVLALDAGSLTSGLTFSEQGALKAVFLSHSHYDHIRDIPGLGLNLFRQGKTVDIFCSAAVRETITDSMLNGDLYPRLHERPPETPTVRFSKIAPGVAVSIGQYQVRALPVAHVKETFGFEVCNDQGRTVFYTADTGPLSEGYWGQTDPDLLVIETTAPSSQTEMVRVAGHLTPGLLEEELVRFRSLRGHLPRVLTVHMDPLLEGSGELDSELADVASRLGADIRVATEGLEIEI